MKRLLSAFLLTLSLATQAGLPPTTLSGQSATIKPTTFTFKTPYNQSTQISGIESMVETGSENMLVNPGFEGVASTVPNGWTCTTGTCTKTTTSGEFSSGKAAMKVALSAQAMNVSQTVTTVSGIQKQGYARVIYRVPSTMTDFQICSLVDAAEQTCVPTANLVKDDTFRSIEVPLIFGSTSAGVKFKTTSSFTANAYFDGVIVAQGLGTQNLMLDNSYSAKIGSATGTITGENKDWISGNCSFSAPDYTCTFTTGVFTVAPNCTAGWSESGTSLGLMKSVSSTGFVATTFGSTTGNPSSGGMHVSCQKSGNDYLASSANVYSQASANYDWTAYTPTLTGFGTPTGVFFYHRRLGGNIEIRGRFTSGTSTATEARLSLPNSLISSSSIATLETAQGFWQRDLASAAHGSAMLMEPSVGYITFGQGDGFSGNAGSGLVKMSASSYVASGNTVFLYASIPISGWSNSSVIVGSFEGIEKCVGNECDDTYSAYVTSPTTITTTSNSGWISSVVNGSTGDYTVNFGASYFTVAPVCTCTTLGGSSRTCSTYSPSATSINVQTLNVSLQNNNFHIICQKQGVDYKPKTAKVASSIGVPTVPGITTEAIDFFIVSYGQSTLVTPCTTANTLCGYIDNIGTSSATVTRGASTGLYTLTAPKTYTKLRCVGSFQNGSADRGITPYSASASHTLSCNSCSSTTFTTGNQGTGALDSFGTIHCIGSY